MTNNINDFLSECLKASGERIFRGEDLPGYAFLYLLHKALVQHIPVSSDPQEMLDKLTLNENIRSQIVNLVKDFNDIDFERVKKFDSVLISGIFQTTKIEDTNAYTKTPEQFYWVIQMLLDLKEEDTFGQFFEHPRGFVQWICENNKATSFTAYDADQKVHIFQQLKENLLGKKENVTTYTFDFNSKDLLLDKYSKIYAFPPIFQRQNIQAKGYQRILQNFDRSQEDKTAYNIDLILNNLEEGGRAVILVSNALFTRNYKNLIQSFLADGYLSGVVHLPKGAIIPANLSLSFLVFDKVKNDSIRFLDLRQVYHSKDKNNILSSVEISQIKKAWQGDEDSYYSDTISYKEIERQNYSLNYASYAKDLLDPIGYILTFSEDNTKSYNAQKSLLEKSEQFSAYVNKKPLFVADNQNQEKSQNDDAPPFILGNEANIFKGFSDNKALHLLEKDFSNGLRYLRISDITDNRIQLSMSYIECLPKSAENFLLQENDLVISRVFPLKIALYNRIYDRILPAGNFLVIRLKEKSPLNPVYLKGFLESENAIKELERIAKGGSLLSLTKGILEQIRIPYKDWDYQTRYQEKYETYEDEIENLEDRIDNLKSKRNSLIFDKD